MKNKLAIALAAISAFVGFDYHKVVARIKSEMGTRKKNGGGRGGFAPPRHARARAWKKAFGGVCVPRIDNTQFMFE